MAKPEYPLIGTRAYRGAIMAPDSRRRTSFLPSVRIAHEAWRAVRGFRAPAAYIDDAMRF